MKIPPGWKLVPIEPTDEMLAAACEAALSTDVLLDDTRFACDRASYAAAIAAAPEVPEMPNLCRRRGGNCVCQQEAECIHHG